MAEARRRSPWLAYLALGLGAAAFCLLLLQLLLGRRLEQARIRQLGPELAARLVLGEVALERFSPADLAGLSGMRLAEGERPESRASREAGLQAEARQLRLELCRRLQPCPVVWPSPGRPRGVWVEMGSSLERAWLFAPLPPLRGWPPDSLLLGFSLGGGALASGLLFLALEVQRPLRQLQAGLEEVGLEERPPRLPARGTRTVQRLTGRFNAMLERLDEASRERATMLAGIAHDLRAPLTRLRLRLGLAAEGTIAAPELARALADLGALERITGQFLLFAGAESGEPAVELPLQELLAEAAAGVADAVPLVLDLEPLQRRVRPTALSRAVANLLGNALAHGRPPLRLELRPREPAGEGFAIAVWDSGAGIPADQWERARQPFQRLDASRGAQGHAGLGLAIAERVARDHGGGLERRAAGPGEPPGFAVVLQGRSLP